MIQTMWANHALQRTRRERRGCHRWRPVRRVAELGSFGDMKPRLLNQACWILLMLARVPARRTNSIPPIRAVGV